MKFNFEGPPMGRPGIDVSAQLRPLIREIVQEAAAAGWDQDDVLLTVVEVAWDLYEQRRDDL
ncbi:hypothetical protein LB577_22850 [Mesorhizobium sp. B283B1A]|uniref:hypothetical protein n=1 Tax=Mesorhizobium TaxID=68287 RepID=UPI001CD18A70|nr:MULTISPECIES: hypothetical protein [Mesorhizobium]MCA0049753.1 hypothetical protein [Mesorhizobium sp. B283B1A]UQS66803.1 hypothetical protein M5D98_10910 [Mesorhizobium opportunistum]